MSTKMDIKKGLAIVLMALSVATASAWPRHFRHIGHRGFGRPIVTTVIARPAVTTRISNRLSKKDRLEMAMAYLKENPSLSISKYSKMTGLTKAMAEAELDAFAVNNDNPIRLVRDGKKKLYAA